MITLDFYGGDLAVSVGDLQPSLGGDLVPGDFTPLFCCNLSFMISDLESCALEFSVGSSAGRAI